MGESNSNENAIADESSPRNESKPKVIVVAVDGSQGSEIALKKAVHFLGVSKEQSIFHLVHVRPDQDEYQVDSLYGFKSHWDEVGKQRTESSRKILQRFKAIAEAAGVESLEVLLQGDPREEILNYVEKAKAELLVVGERGRGILKRLFIGSVSSHCLHHANIPVLIVKAPAATSSTA